MALRGLREKVAEGGAHPLSRVSLIDEAALGSPLQLLQHALYDFLDRGGMLAGQDDGGAHHARVLQHLLLSANELHKFEEKAGVGSRLCRQVDAVRAWLSQLLEVRKGAVEVRPEQRLELKRPQRSGDDLQVVEAQMHNGASRAAFFCLHAADLKAVEEPLLGLTVLQERYGLRGFSCHALTRAPRLSPGAQFRRGVSKECVNAVSPRIPSPHLHKTQPCRVRW